MAGNMRQFDTDCLMSFIIKKAAFAAFLMMKDMVQNNFQIAC
jgi:hypothetical protein